jgi:hypothetical protein
MKYGGLSFHPVAHTPRETVMEVSMPVFSAFMSIASTKELPKRRQELKRTTVPPSLVDLQLTDWVDIKDATTLKLLKKVLVSYHNEIQGLGDIPGPGLNPKLEFCWRLKLLTLI